MAWARRRPPPYTFARRPPVDETVPPNKFPHFSSFARRLRPRGRHRSAYLRGRFGPRFDNSYPPDSTTHITARLFLTAQIEREARAPRGIMNLKALICSPAKYAHAPRQNVPPGKTRQTYRREYSDIPNGPAPKFP
jgi:hypothetical protein